MDFRLINKELIGNLTEERVNILRFWYKESKDHQFLFP